MHPDHEHVHATTDCCSSHWLCNTPAGGSAGIGRAVALGLSNNGAIVTVLARRKDRLDAVVQQLNKVALGFTGRFEGVCVS